ncbi:hypothetical protein [Ferruginibacter sp. HRS2-29]|uniref:hypothetical protein n=1 Tax=Ferruginibacter sp. HRS2-29 TaxID=2487334 RepID=UPI0020CD2C3E|nr:hypothetical protein [Ferruginibacter sp. HRS2-29]MCP9752529.1 hypothetical protein [Ferruginibacter sp. HRS2-29]
MKFSAKEFIITLVLAVAIFFLAQYIYPTFHKVAVPQVEDAYFSVTNFDSAFNLGLKFSLIWAAIPLILFFVWKLIPDLTPSKKAATVLFVAGGVLIAIFIRRYFVQQELEKLVVAVKDVAVNKKISDTLDNINFEYWMTVGLLSGTILCFILFKKKRRKWTK